MTLRQSENVLRALVALALGFGLVGFATHGSHARDGQLVHAVEAAASEQATADVTPIADAVHRAGI